MAMLAAPAAQGAVALSLGPLADMHERATTDPCEMSTRRGVSVTESLERATPTDEGKIRSFDRAFWRPEFAHEGYPQIERSRTLAEGSLAVSDRSVTFVPPPGTTSVRIPFELVQDVEVRSDAGTGQPGSMIVKSCFGRFDVVAFRRAGKPDSAATAEAAAELKARVAAFQVH